MNMDGRFKYSNHLGSFCPFYFRDETGKLVIRSTFEEIISIFPYERTLDWTAIFSFINKNYIIGDRTLVKGIYRAPWMAYPNEDLTDWCFHALPEHGHLKLTAAEIGKRLYLLLCEEILEYVGNHKRVGILLSGGMDSRIVAGVLNDLIQDKKVQVDKVVAYTWGNTDSRDYVYSQKIALRLGWEFQHFLVDEKKLWENYLTAARVGAEYSGIHLHGMVDVSKTKEVDLMLAGSYGDSVGRAEYSGRHVSKVPKLTEGMKNIGGLIAKLDTEEVLKELNTEMQGYYNKFPRRADYQYNEIDYQLHYMRRMLNPCMELIHQQVPLRQVFTHPKVFGFMWSLDPSCRNDEVYVQVLKQFKTNLNDIPWARTGKPYMQKGGEPDSWKKAHHSYSNYIQFNHWKTFVSHQYTLMNLDMLVLRKLQSLVKYFPNFNFRFLEIQTYLFSVNLFVKKYNIQNEHLPIKEGKENGLIRIYLKNWLKLYVRKIIFKVRGG